MTIHLVCEMEEAVTVAGKWLMQSIIRVILLHLGISFDYQWIGKWVRVRQFKKL